ncbi:MAG: hypothetical protein U0797_19070 [Gemmataceae bacterium]
MARRAVQKRPNDPIFLNTLGVALYRAGRIRDAVSHLEKALAMGTGTADGHALYFLAMCYHRLGGPIPGRRSASTGRTAGRTRPRQLPPQLRELRLFRAEAERTLKAPPLPGSP